MRACGQAIGLSVVVRGRLGQAVVMAGQYADGTLLLVASVAVFPGADLGAG